MRIALIGGVGSTLVVLKKLRQYDFLDVHVFGYRPSSVKDVSGWVDLELHAVSSGYKYSPFLKVKECFFELQQYSPDYIFAVVLSQIIPTNILQIPLKGIIGFHPTKLPLGRGRAPLAWLILDQKDGAATFFLMREGVDDGPIISQVPFNVHPDDDASSVEKKMLEAESIALDELLPKLSTNRLSSFDQSHDLSTFYGKRAPVDGLIDWCKPVASILLLIRASSKPHPGAYTFHNDTRIVIFKASSLESSSSKGVIGRILSVDHRNTFTIQCGDSLIHVLDWSASTGWKPVVGIKLGYYCEDEIYRLRSKVASLESRISHLEQLLSSTNPPL